MVALRGRRKMPVEREESFDADAVQYKYTALFTNRDT